MRGGAATKARLALESRNKDKENQKKEMERVKSMTTMNMSEGDLEDGVSVIQVSFFSLFEPRTLQ